MAMNTNNGIELTQCGQPRHYADSIYAGTVTAESEAEAREKLTKMRGVREILDRQDKDRWSCPYFTEFDQVEPGKWKFHIVEEYTD